EVAGMRDLIAREKGEGDGWDLKLAPGGLMDLDFIAQALVLVHAHRHPLAGLPTQAVLVRAGELGLVDVETSATLVDAHRILDDIMHWQRLTFGGSLEAGDRSPATLRRLAAVAGAPDPANLRSWLDEIRQGVRTAFDRVLRGF
ncbi:MAG TPA: bifunctional [glutamine synthetase] adenylyltransferase/[glutamine synthetase]-adenylyl-L-tyrosine phosphorylase, partial [Enterovirga sp.]|nr:bifunctional [glutamine synthetase] adenylyltransferase/[glutamine synthetase]-adenylyl-L-tyrosine phosphorylase [Enterovirga sp.]